METWSWWLSNAKQSLSSLPKQTLWYVLHMWGLYFSWAHTESLATKIIQEGKKKIPVAPVPHAGTLAEPFEEPLGTLLNEESRTPHEEHTNSNSEDSWPLYNRTSLRHFKYILEIFEDSEVLQRVHPVMNQKGTLNTFLFPHEQNLKELKQNILSDVVRYNLYKP